jgi:murein L,D-transpeptidase YcbB/YkuD
VCAVTPGLGPAALAAAEGPLPQDLRAALDRGEPLHVEGFTVRTALLRRFYEPQGFAPVWGPDPDGVARAALALGALAASRDHGLDPREYGGAALIRRASPSGPHEAVERELVLTDALLRYAVDVHAGRLRPERVQADWGIPAPPREEPVRELAEAVESSTLAAWLEGLPPAHPGYTRLVTSLHALHAIADAGGWPPVPPGPSLAANRPDPRLPLLRRRLVLGGDLVAETAADDAALERAIRRFQARHAIEPDGVAGAETLAALNVPVRTRIRQVSVNLERWRWLPPSLGPRHLLVNAADGKLAVVDHGRVVLASRVVVGDELHPTPVVHSQIGALVFHPPWTVPTSIVVDEFLPKLRDNPRLLADNDIIVLDRPKDPYGLALDWEALPRDRFPLRLQQRPGGGNPLGRVRFATPNRFDVYLHDTPLPELFARQDRALSHGCVRVEQAERLAALVLAGQSAGRPETLRRLLAEKSTRSVVVADPLPVYFLYWTAFVDEEGRLQHRDDVYDRDARVATALVRPPGTTPPRAVPVRLSPARPGPIWRLPR